MKSEVLCSDFTSVVDADFRMKIWWCYQNMKSRLDTNAETISNMLRLVKCFLFMAKRKNFFFY